MGLRVEIDRGLVLLVAAPYDETIVAWIRTLPERRYRRESQDWIMPARREHLRTLCSLIGELEERGIDVEICEDAGARRARVDVGRAMLRNGVIEIAGQYSERRLPALRALPERHFDPERRIWTVPLTRAGALAILALADRADELVITQRAHRALQRATAATPAAQHGLRDHPHVGPTRRSPVAHWRTTPRARPSTTLRAGASRYQASACASGSAWILATATAMPVLRRERLGMSRLDELLTSDEVAELLHIPRSTVSEYARRGVLPSIKLGRHRRFVRSDVADAIERLRLGRAPTRSQTTNERGDASAAGRSGVHR